MHLAIASWSTFILVVICAAFVVGISQWRAFVLAIPPWGRLVLWFVIMGSLGTAFYFLHGHLHA
jgi:hypothetical protein